LPSVGPVTCSAGAGRPTAIPAALAAAVAAKSLRLIIRVLSWTVAGRPPGRPSSGVLPVARPAGNVGRRPGIGLCHAVKAVP